MKINLEYPRLIYSNRDPDVFKDITMLGISFPTTLHYIKNYDSNYSEFVFTILGFGVRVILKKEIL